LTGLWLKGFSHSSQPRCFGIGRNPEVPIMLSKKYGFYRFAWIAANHVLPRVA
jgi:hypothetical protein